MQTTEPHAGANLQANGVVHDVDVDALPIASSPLLPSGSIPLLELCQTINDRVALFLAVDAPSERLRKVQEQTKIALDVIREALDKYSYVHRS
jgi:hypothetical protein